MAKVRFTQYIDPAVLARLKTEAKRQRRSAAFLCEMILDDNLPKDNSPGNAEVQPGGKADRQTDSN